MRAKPSGLAWLPAVAMQSRKFDALAFDFDMFEGCAEREPQFGQRPRLLIVTGFHGFRPRSCVRSIV